MKCIGVIGTGAMGPQLAAFFAGCGVRTILFGRRGKAHAARANLVRSRPAALYTASDLNRIEAADLQGSANRIGECAWIVECAAEHIQAKREIYLHLAQHVAGDAIVTSSTSGFLRRSLVEGMDPDLRERFFITHFFYPPRHMKLVEIIAGDGVDGKAVNAIEQFLQARCGKGVVRTKDTPNFIANRIGMQHVMDAIHLVVEEGWPVDAVDAVMGPVTGRLPSGIFGMVDMMGVHTVASIAGNALTQLSQDQYTCRCRIPQYMQRMITHGWIGDACGQGFYRREGAKQFVIDPSRLSYRPRLKFFPPSLAHAAEEGDVATRLRSVVMAKDPGGEIAWRIVSNILVHAAERADEIADDLDSIDRAMRWGFGWELGPFESWQAIGIEAVCARLAAEGRAVPARAQELIRAGRTSFLRERARETGYSWGEKKAISRDRTGYIVDGGDDIAVMGIDRARGTLSSATIGYIDDVLTRVERDYGGLIIASESDNLWGHPDLYDILNRARLKRFGDLDAMFIVYQKLAGRLRSFSKPLVMALGGRLCGMGLELCLAAPVRQSWVESAFRYDHIFLGLIPMAGGCITTLRRFEDAGGGPYPKVKKAFEAIGGALRCGSAIDARKQGLLVQCDGITMDRDELIDDAKRAALKSMRAQRELTETEILLPGRGGEMALKNEMRAYMRRGVLSADDAFVCERLAHVLAGGDRPTVHRASESHVMDLEREANLSLLGTPLAQRRIEHFLKTGRYLR